MYRKIVGSILRSCTLEKSLTTSSTSYLKNQIYMKVFNTTYLLTFYLVLLLLGQSLITFHPFVQQFLQ